MLSGHRLACTCECCITAALDTHYVSALQGLQLQEHIVELGRAFVDGVRQLKLSEEEVEEIWMNAMSPGGQKLFKAHMDEVRAKVKPLHDSMRVMLT